MAAKNGKQAQVVPGFSKGLTGQRQGSRVLIAMPGKDGYDASGGSPQAAQPGVASMPGPANQPGLNQQGTSSAVQAPGAQMMGMVSA